MSSVDISSLFEIQVKLFEAGEEAGKHTELYDRLLASSNNGVTEKKFAAQFIPMYMKHFPQKLDESLEKILCLCEDSDVAVSY